MLCLVATVKTKQGHRDIRETILQKGDRVYFNLKTQAITFSDRKGRILYFKKGIHLEKEIYIGIPFTREICDSIMTLLAAIARLDFRFLSQNENYLIYEFI